MSQANDGEGGLCTEGGVTAREYLRSGRAMGDFVRHFRAREAELVARVGSPAERFAKEFDMGDDSAYTVGAITQNAASARDRCSRGL